MVANSLELWVSQYVLEHYMESNRRRMCLELKVSEGMLNKAFARDACPELSLVFEECVRYLVDKSEDINAIFQAYYRLMIPRKIGSASTK